MPAPATIDDFLDVMRKSNQIDTGRLEAYLNQHRRSDTLPPEPKKLAALLIREGLLTSFQAEQFLQGRYKGFLLGGYRLIERIGSGGMGTVYLAEHEVMRRRVALKVLPPNVAGDQAILERFRREAQASAVLDHPNIVRAYDFRHEGQVHFLVMEYVNGPNLQHVLDSQGPLSVGVACEYVRQAALGLEHAHEAGLVHRDIKPGNLLVDASGAVKILDMGLARFTPEGQESVTKKFDENSVMGTADYLAPEQAIDLHNVDSRADVYSLGATLYALLAGEAPFSNGTVTQKLLWHQLRDPTPLDERRQDVPADLADVVATMMAKSPEQRFQTGKEVAEALAPFCSSTPTPQGPARVASSNGGTPSSRVKPPTTRPVTPRKKPVTAAPSSTGIAERPKRRFEEPEDPPERPRRRDPEDHETPPRADSSGVVGILLLVGVVGGILVVVGGVIAFLVWGPAPNAPSRGPDDEQRQLSLPTRPESRDQPRPRPLADTVGEVAQFRGHQGGVERVAFSADGSRLVTSGQDRIIRIWDVYERQQKLQIQGHGLDIYSVGFNRIGSQVLSSSADGTARLWTLANTREDKRFIAQETGKLWAAIYGRDESEVITGGDDRTVRLWSVATGKAIRPMSGHTGAIKALAYRPGPRHQVLSASLDASLRLWDLDKGTTLRTLTGHKGACNSVAVDKDGRMAVSAGGDASVRVWDVEAGKNVHTFTGGQGHKGAVWTVALSPDGRRVVSGGTDRKVRLWDLKHKKLEHTYEGHANNVSGLSFAPSGRHFASCSLDGSIRIWGVPPLKP